MSRRKVAPWLLAASVLLSGSTAALVGSMTPAQAITSVEELRDVDSSHWAYQALSDLVEKYDVIEGYPDYTFRGNRQATRWEMAAALNALVKAVGRDLARLGAEKANKSDLATLARLQDEFRNELAALNSKVGALESRAAAIEAKNAEQDTRLDLLEKTQLHGDFSFGVLADMGNNGLGGGIEDGISTLGRFRLGVKVPVVPGYDNSSIGQGDVVARLVGAFGRWTPQNTGTTGAVNPYPISGYSALSGDSSWFNEGVQPDSYTLGSFGGAGLNTRQNLYVESAYYKQNFKSGIPVLTDLLPGVNVFPDNDSFRTTADLYVGIIPWRNLFNRSPYKGDELNQFQNTALVNNVGLLVNNVTPTLALAWHQGLGQHLSADLTGAVSSFNVGDFLSGWSVTEELAFNYDTSFLGSTFTKPGTIYVGGYHIFFNGQTSLASLPLTTNDRDGNPLFTNNSTTNALFMGMNQEWWRGIGTSVDWVLNETGANNAVIQGLRQGQGANVALLNTTRTVGVQHALSAALSVPMTVFNPNLTNRAKDAWGLGYSLINPTDAPSEGTTFTRRDEHVFETYYRWAVNNSVTVIPSAQVILNRFGVRQNQADVVIGFRTNYVF